MRRCLLLLPVLLLVLLAGKLAADNPAVPAVAPASAAAAAPAEPAAAISAGDTAWVLIAAAMVLLMTPALAFFYGGMVRRKNILGVLMQCFIVMAAVSVQWVLCGYSLAFAPEPGLCGSLAWAGLNGVGLEPYAGYAATIPHQAFMLFQMMFAVITPALIVGALAERMKFSAFLLFILLWSTLVYDTAAHWVWGLGGWLRELGALDFAGGTVIHVNAGIAGLVAALYLGKRRNSSGGIYPHNLPLVVLGAGLLWFGWFGFNAGSALAANGVAVSAMVVTNTAAAAAALCWALLDWALVGKPTMLGTVSGAVAGLVAITPAAGYVGVMPAVIIGVVAAAACYLFVVYLKPKLGYDDTLDVFGVHGVGGIWGALATGLFASKAVNPAGADGLLAGNPQQLLVQIQTVTIIAVFAAAATWLLLKLVDLAVGVRVSHSDEMVGLDLSQHHERAYTLID